VGIAWIEQVDTTAEYQRHADPEGRHLQGLRHTYLMLSFLAERLQVDQQHDKNQYIKQNPRPEGHTCVLHLNFFSFYRLQRYMIILKYEIFYVGFLQNVGISLNRAQKSA
jgi:hypothetical protein